MSIAKYQTCVWCSKQFDGGRVVVDTVELPIKCPVAPLEITFLAESFFTGKGITKLNNVFAGGFLIDADTNTAVFASSEIDTTILCPGIYLIGLIFWQFKCDGIEPGLIDTADTQWFQAFNQ